MTSTSKTYPQPDFSPRRLQHSSYNLADPSHNVKTAMEVADTLQDYFDLARQNKLSNPQLDDFTKFVDQEHVFKVGSIAIPEIAQMAGEDHWLSQEQAQTPRSAQTVHILHAIAHLEPRSRRLSRAPDQTDEQREDLLRRAQDALTKTRSADSQANGAASASGGPMTRESLDEMTGLGEEVRGRGDKGRASWAERHE